MNTINSIPEGFHTITPHMIINDAAAAIDFYKRAFGAEELPAHDAGWSVRHARYAWNWQFRAHAERGIPCPGWLSPQPNQGTTVTLHLYVEDVDTAFARAVEAGCNPNMPPMDAFWGDRYGQVFDAYGHSWSIATHKADLTEGKIAKAAGEMFKEASVSRCAPDFQPE